MNTNHPVRNSSLKVTDPRDQHDYPGFEGGRIQIPRPINDPRDRHDYLGFDVGHYQTLQSYRNPIDQDDCIMKSIKVEAPSFVGQLDPKEYLD